MSAMTRGGTFVVGARVYGIRVASSEDIRTALVTVTLDGRFEWSLTVPGWREVSVGAAHDVGYLWSARDVVELPRTGESELRLIGVDEDLLAVFHVDGGWLLVCETSIRRLLGEVETARIELGDVVDFARWERGVLWVRDDSGKDTAIRVVGEHLIVAT